MSNPIFEHFAETARLTLSAGQTLFRLGQEVADIFLVLSGRIALERHTPHGQRLVLQTAGPGTILAEASAYSRQYHCDAVARETSTVAMMPKAQFLAMLAQEPSLAVAWATALARGVQAARLKAEIRTLPRLQDRLDAWLDAGHKLPPKGQWQEVADELGVTREAFYRELARRRRAHKSFTEPPA
ncbi:Crp/Fnr family transcriptional regulator [Paenirhodobacter enshiensis]|uniref:Crp/Fnr family transcriptional regulator n=1 Tax=Paenirhodobacter enshiensis TaxID=1105367 RepID=UPI0035B18A33